ncbi:hypothetical protein [Gelidibacter salicanalis]|uniref:Uncharacterized protein n=1 Tax=Gelidibacter salicanalis TaxID=291193 RepID=A0A934KYF3_9FLAO|nr:hypothetical protein [Gelidibacter salicanalis]MBJ7882882.1 hypothetical protein [Gelidibacter salicanalis]
METPSHFGLSVSGNKKYKSAFSHFGITFAGVDPIWINGVNPFKLKSEMPDHFNVGKKTKVNGV